MKEFNIRREEDFEQIRNCRREMSNLEIVGVIHTLAECVEGLDYKDIDNGTYYDSMNNYLEVTNSILIEAEGKDFYMDKLFLCEGNGTNIYCEAYSIDEDDNKIYVLEL